MSREGILLLTLRDEERGPVREKVAIELTHQRGATDRKTLKDVDASRTVRIEGLREAPDGLYQLLVEAPSFRPVRQSVNVRGETCRRLDPGAVDKRARPRGLKLRRE